MKCIQCPEDMALWMSSPASAALIRFLQKIGEAILERPRSTLEMEQEAKVLSDTERLIINGLSVLLGDIAALAQNVPLVPMASRYGNQAFKVFHKQLCQLSLPFSPLDQEAHGFLRQVLCLSFGNPIRLDYGSGHELFFFIFCLVLDEQMRRGSAGGSAAYHRCLGIGIICRQYVAVARGLQARFMLEPAGSHGVWGLDDYQFLPFLLGSAQMTHFDDTKLRGELVVTPQVAIGKGVLENKRLCEKFVYLDCLAHVHSLKTRVNPTVPFAQHSPLLHDIAVVPTWRRIYDGLGRMYLNEVLGKFPIMQHLLFHARLFPFKEGE